MHTCKNNVQGSALANTTFFHESALVGLHQLKDEPFFGLGIHLCVALGNHVKRKRTVAVFNGSRHGCLVQNSQNDLGAGRSVTLAGNGLVENSSGNVIVHNHGRHGDPRVAADALEDRAPFAAPAK